MKLLRNCLGPFFKVTLSFLETLSTSRLLDKLSLCYFIPEAWTASAFFCACILVTHNISSPSLIIVPAVPYMSSPVGKNWDANTKSAIHSKTCMRITTSRISAKVFFPLHFQQAFCHFLGLSTNKLMSPSVVIAFFYSTVLHTNKLLDFFFS